MTIKMPIARRIFSNLLPMDALPAETIQFSILNSQFSIPGRPPVRRGVG
jgi:hypothetical protein